MPSDPKTRHALLDMQDDILLAQPFVRGLTFDVFKSAVDLKQVLDEVFNRRSPPTPPRSDLT